MRRWEFVFDSDAVQQYGVVLCMCEHSGQTSTHAQMDIFLAAARQFPAQNFKEKHWKQPV